MKCAKTEQISSLPIEKKRPEDKNMILVFFYVTNPTLIITKVTSVGCVCNGGKGVVHAEKYYSVESPLTTIPSSTRLVFLFSLAHPT